MEEKYDKLLREGYGLQLLSGKRVRTGYLCKTDEGLRELRKVTLPKHVVLFEHDLKEHLRQEGFSHVMPFCVSKEGLPYIAAEGTLYVLEEVLSWEALPEEDADTFVKGAEILARFHQKSAGLSSQWGKQNQQDFLKTYEKRRIEVLKIKKQIDKKSCYSPLDLLVKQQFSYYMEKIELAKKILLEADYGTVLQRDLKNHTICHNAFKGENLKQDNQGNIYISGLQKCTYDTPLLDIAAYFRRFLKKQNWNAQVASRMLSAYEKERPLSHQEKKVLFGMVCYPEKFMSLCNEYYNKRRVCVSPAMLERMEQCIAGAEKQDALAAWLQQQV